MAPAGPELTPPQSYTTLPVQDISVSHYPEDSPTATPVIIVRLNRPKKLNAFTIAMTDSFETLFPILSIDPRVKCIVLTGSGSAFCAGADLDVGFPVQNERINDHRDSGGRLNLAIYRCRKPTIVAINGAAVGIGMTMTLSAAIRIAYAKAKCGFPFVRRGITMESNSSFFLPRLIGYSKAVYLTTTGEVYLAESKHFGDLFQEVVERKEDVLPRALELAGAIAGKTSSLAGFLTRELMWRNPGSAEGTHLVDSPVLYHLFQGE